MRLRNHAQVPANCKNPCLVFGTAIDAGTPPFEVLVCALDNKPLRTSAGFTIAVERDLSAIDEADIVVMPAWFEDCRRVLDWVLHNLAQPHAIDALAARAAMSRRNFTRHFRQATGTSSKQWLLSQRLAQAQRMLECTNVAIEVVAGEAGFGTALSRRQHFRANLHTSPSSYRRQFRAGRA